jgi:hypothetical protein
MPRIFVCDGIGNAKIIQLVVLQQRFALVRDLVSSAMMLMF